MAAMTTPQRFFISLVVLILATCGLIGFVTVAFMFFTYRGNGMDWIYPTSGVFTILWLGSAYTAVESGIKMLRDHFRRKTG
jgi:hypothetical protein